MRNNEEQEQIALFQWAAYAQGRHPELTLLHHIPNGGQRNKATAARLKAAGVKRGVPDLCLPVPRKGYHGLYIELKAGKNKPTQEQREWCDALNEQGYLAVTCYGFDEARDALVAYLS